MYTINVDKVVGKLAEKRYTRASFAKALKISSHTLSNYLKHPEKTPYRVMAKMSELLCDTKDEMVDIFFAS